MALANLPEGFNSAFSRILAEGLKAAYPTRLADLNSGQLATLIQNTLPQMFPNTLSLVRSQPDYELVLAQLMTEVERSNAWADTDISATGQMILRAIAADVDFAQFSIARALQEAFPETARTDEGVLLGARMLGNRIKRAIPAEVSATITRVDSSVILTIPAYSRWDIQYPDDARKPFFNRERVVFHIGELTTNVVLHSGEVMESTIRSTGTKLQRAEVGFETRKTADTDVRVFVDDAPWVLTREQLWQHGPLDKVFNESTTAANNVEVLFGSGEYGAIPPLNSIIKVNWVETNGAEGNRSETGLVVKPALNATTGYGSLTGLTTSPASGGADAVPVVFYKLFSGDQRAARQRAIRRQDYRVHSIDFGYPVRDAVVRGQRDIAPGRPSMMNVLESTLLCVPALTTAQWLKYVDYMANLGVYDFEIRRRDPQAKPITINAEVYCSKDAVLTEVAAVVKRRVYEAFEPGIGSLGYSWYLSDVTTLLEGVNELQGLVEYVKLLSPITHVECSNNMEWVQLTGLTISMFYTTRNPILAQRQATPLTLRFGASGLQIT